MKTNLSVVKELRRNETPIKKFDQMAGAQNSKALYQNETLMRNGKNQPFFCRRQAQLYLS